MIFKHKKTDKKYEWLASCSMKKSGQDDVLGVVYYPIYNPHMVCCREEKEFYELFEAIEWKQNDIVGIAPT